MAITPKPGYIVDPNNPNGVIGDRWYKGIPGMIDLLDRGSTSITGEMLQPATAIQVPPTPTDTTNYDAIMKGGQGAIDAYNKAVEDAKKAETKTDASSFETLLAKYSQPPTPIAGQYQTEYANAGLGGMGEDVLAKQKTLKTAQSKLAGVTAKLAGINAEAQAIPIKVEKEFTGRASVGQQESMSRAQLRDVALRALPLQAEALATQAEVQSAQGDVELSQNTLKMAQDRLDTLFNLKVKDQEAQYNYQKDVRGKIYDYLTSKEKAQLDALQKKDDREFQLYKDQINNVQAFAKTAIENGQGSLASQLANLDPKSTTYQSDKAALVGQMKQKSDLQFVPATDNQPAGYFDKTTGRFTPIGGGGDIAKQTKEELQSVKTANDVSAILNDPAFNDTFGLTSIAYRNIPGNAAYALKANVDNLISNLALAARGQLKGQGAVSDFEGRMLRNAQTALKLNMNPAQARKELVKVRGAILTSSGQTAMVKIISPNEKDARLGEADQKTITDAVKAGYRVEYQ